MIHAGIDIGSRTIKLAVVENGTVKELKKTINSYNPLVTCREIMAGVKFDTLTATGYGRHLIKNYMNCNVISEIKAFAAGARIISSECRTVLDIGGQDTKAISLDESGRLNRFEMNDKCAAGTGRYLKIPCACMTPNNRRLVELDKLIDKYKPDAVIDIVLQACHGYNIESHKVGEHIIKKRNLPFLKIITDYSQCDTGQIKTRIEALFESVK